MLVTGFTLPSNGRSGATRWASKKTASETEMVGTCNHGELKRAPNKLRKLRKGVIMKKKPQHKLSLMKLKTLFRNLRIDLSKIMNLPITVRKELLAVDVTLTGTCLLSTVLTVP